MIGFGAKKNPTGLRWALRMVGGTQELPLNVPGIINPYLYLLIRIPPQKTNSLYFQKKYLPKPLWKLYRTGKNQTGRERIITTSVP